MGIKMMELKQLKQLMYQKEDENHLLFEEVSNIIFNHPELGDQEYFSAKYLTEQIKQLGFSVEMPYKGLETAFRCELGDDEGPCIAFLAEYDALPGYGSNRKENAHACGHNWIAASTFAACAALASVKEHFQGKIVFMGTPAEETIGRKIDLVEYGAFDDIDAVYQMHLGLETVIDCKALAVTDFYFTFEGLASHASGCPEKGINALDAVTLTFAGINALRQHTKPDVKIHGIIIEGGQAANIVPDHCVMHVMIRAADKNYLEEVVDKVCNCAKGAELMTGAKLTMKRARNTFYDLKNNEVMMNMMKEDLAEQGITDIDKEEVYTAGSTDIGNVGYASPTCYVELGTKKMGPHTPHDAAYLDIVNSNYSYQLLHKGAKAMAAGALAIFCSKEIREQVREKRNQ
ncbi:MAG: amidohydrolase [Lachnospiraceae bacterium]|nr:amidohydrolase [Lachnospiraceae bacterium]